MVKNCDLGLENAALGLRPRAVFSRPRSQFFTIRTSQPANNIYFSSAFWTIFSLIVRLVSCPLSGFRIAMQCSLRLIYVKMKAFSQSFNPRRSSFSFFDDKRV